MLLHWCPCNTSVKLISILPRKVLKMTWLLQCQHHWFSRWPLFAAVCHRGKSVRSSLAEVWCRYLVTAKKAKKHRAKKMSESYRESWHVSLFILTIVTQHAILCNLPFIGLSFTSNSFWKLVRIQTEMSASKWFVSCQQHLKCRFNLILSYFPTV